MGEREREREGADRSAGRQGRPQAHGNGGPGSLRPPAMSPCPSSIHGQAGSTSRECGQKRGPREREYRPVPLQSGTLAAAAAAAATPPASPVGWLLAATSSYLYAPASVGRLHSLQSKAKQISLSPSLHLSTHSPFAAEVPRRTGGEGRRGRKVRGHAFHRLS